MKGAKRQKIRRDPAPSRLFYRWQRIWLTPVYRKLIGYGLPLAVLAFVGYSIWSNPEVQRQMDASLLRAKESVEKRPEFQVQLMRLEGVDEHLAGKVRQAADLNLPVSSFHLDLDDVRRRIESIDAIKKASLFVRAGGVLEVVIEERIPAVIWRGSKQLEILDENGILVGYIANRSVRPDLPLIAGEGVAPHIYEALELLAAAGPVAERVRGLIRVGERRWDLVLDRGQRVLLPENDPISAVEYVMALQAAQNVLSRDITVMDMRDTRRPILRLSDAALEDRRLRRAIAKDVDLDL
jgi:cell division protein FtsQ